MRRQAAALAPPQRGRWPSCSCPGSGAATSKGGQSFRICAPLLLLSDDPTHHARVQRRRVPLLHGHGVRPPPGTPATPVRRGGALSHSHAPKAQSTEHQIRIWCFAPSSQQERIGATIEVWGSLVEMPWALVLWPMPGMFVVGRAGHRFPSQGGEWILLRKGVPPMHSPSSTRSWCTCWGALGVGAVVEFVDVCGRARRALSSL